MKVIYDLTTWSDYTKQPINVLSNDSTNLSDIRMMMACTSNYTVCQYPSACSLYAWLCKTEFWT